MFIVNYLSWNIIHIEHFLKVFIITFEPEINFEKKKHFKTCLSFHTLK